MEKKPHSVMRDPSFKEVMERLLFELTQRPKKGRVINSVEQPKDDVLPPSPLPSPPNFCIHLCFPNEDMAVLKQKYKVLGSLPVTSNDHFKNLGFVGNTETLMFIRDKKVEFPGKSLYALGRSWFKEGVTEKDKRVPMEMHKKEKCHGGDDDNEAKGYLQEFVEQAKAARALARMARKKGKTVQMQVHSTSAPRCGKRKKFVPKMRSLTDIIMAIDKEHGN